MRLTVPAGRHTVGFREDTDEMGKVVKADKVADFGDGLLGVRQQLAGGVQTVVREEL